MKLGAEAVAQCYCRRLTGDEPAEEEWEEAGKLARVAWDDWVPRDAQVAQVARVAWDAWVAWGAWGALRARVAWDALRARVAWDALSALDFRGAPNEVRLWQRDRLLHHLRNSPVPETVEPGR